MNNPEQIVSSKLISSKQQEILMKPPWLRLLKRNNKQVIWLISLLMFMGGCAGSARVKISELTANPQKYHEKVVTVKGKVIQTLSIPILSIGIAKIDDGTGEIWVKPTGRALFEGQKITLKGVLKIAATLGSETFGNIVVEEDPGK